MSNKRNLKKSVHYICGDLAGECLMALHFMPDADAAKLNQAIVEIANLQEETLAKMSFSFDKTARDFESGKAYRHALHEYNTKAFATLTEQFNDRVKQIVHLMNEAMPASRKEANKAAAANK